MKDDEAIMMAENLHNLIQLNLESNEITDRGAIALAKAFFPQLRILNVLLNPISEKGVKVLEKLRRKTKGRAYVYWG